MIEVDASYSMIYVFVKCYRRELRQSICPWHWNRKQRVCSADIYPLKKYKEKMVWVEFLALPLANDILFWMLAVRIHI
jgi:hypothetical protein